LVALEGGRVLSVLAPEPLPEICTPQTKGGPG
jgi:hypothetical protein